MAKKTTRRWVIFAISQLPDTAGPRYIGFDRNVTASKRRAAKFSSSDEAKEFAVSHRIRLDNTTRSLGEDEFSELELTEVK